MSREQNLATLGELPANQKVWVGNLTPETTTEEVDAHFRQLGEPVVAEILRKGTACIAYETSAEAETAISAFNGSEISGAIIQTDVWSQKTPAAGGKKGGAAKGAMKGGGKSGGGFGLGVIPPSLQKGGNAWGEQKGGNAWGAGGGKGAWGAPAAWGGGKGAKSFGAPSPAATAQVFQISVGDNALTQQGYGPEAPAAVYEKGNDAFSSGSHILGEIIDDVAAEVEIVHDADWEQFPDIAEALKAASNEDHCFAVGICASRSKWAIGCASGWKGRESAVKVALGVAFALEDPALASKLAKSYPEFGAILRSQGMSVGGGGGGGWKSGKVAAPAFAALGGKQQETWEEPTLSGETPPLHLVSCPDSKLTAEGYPGDAPAVLHGGKSQKLYFSNAHSILQELVEDLEEVQYVDDPDADQMPEVAAALAAAGAEDSGYCVATCPSQAVWGIGMASGWKFRESAAKMALAIAVAQAQGKIEALAPNYPEFGEICATVGLYQAAPASKKRRKAW